MEENTTVQPEVEEAVETSDAFFDGWDEVDDVAVADDGQVNDVDDSEDPDNTEESEEEDADADQREADNAEGGDADAEAKGESEGDKGTPDQGEFVLKHLGEERKVSRDEVVQLAQKGLDYDRIRERWDSVKNDIPKLRSYEKFLAELASSRGGNIEALMDETMTQILVNRAKAKGEELSASAAAAQAVRMRMEFGNVNGSGDRMETEEQGAIAPGAEGKAQTGRPDSNEMVNRFLREYPTVMAQDIPKEVWDEVNRNGGDLLQAYRGYENKKLAEENKRLQKELESAKQQQKNKARSTGSTKSVGSAATIDPFESGWDEAF